VCLKRKESEGKKSLTRDDGQTDGRIELDLIFPAGGLLGGCICRSGEEDVHDGTKLLSVC
jgi:hypothetical protein